MRRIALVLLLAALQATLLAGCVRYIYRRERVNTPVPEEAMESLVEGREMQQCLDLLGAPVRVWEDPRGIWLAYIWIDQKAPSLSVSVPTGQIFLPDGSNLLALDNFGQKGQGGEGSRPFQEAAAVQWMTIRIRVARRKLDGLL